MNIVIDVPSSAYFFASSLAEELRVPYKRGLAQNNYTGRSFILPIQKKREYTVRQKLNPIKEIINGKKSPLLTTRLSEEQPLNIL